MGKVPARERGGTDPKGSKQLGLLFWKATGSAGALETKVEAVSSNYTDKAGMEEKPGQVSVETKAEAVSSNYTDKEQNTKCERADQGIDILSKSFAKLEPKGTSQKCKSLVSSSQNNRYSG